MQTTTATTTTNTTTKSSGWGVIALPKKLLFDIINIFKHQYCILVLLPFLGSDNNDQAKIGILFA